MLQSYLIAGTVASDIRSSYIILSWRALPQKSCLAIDCMQCLFLHLLQRGLQQSKAQHKVHGIKICMQLTKSHKCSQHVNHAIRQLWISPRLHPPQPLHLELARRRPTKPHAMATSHHQPWQLNKSPQWYQVLIGIASRANGFTLPGSGWWLVMLPFDFRNDTCSNTTSEAPCIPCV